MMAPARFRAAVPHQPVPRHDRAAVLSPRPGARAGDRPAHRREAPRTAPRRSANGRRMRGSPLAEIALVRCASAFAASDSRVPADDNLRTMRPSLLDPLFAALTGLPGIGPKLDKLFARLLGPRDAARDRSAVPSAEPARSTAARGRSCATSCRTRSSRSRSSSASIARRRRTARARPTGSTRATRPATSRSPISSAQPGLSGEAAARGRAALRLGHGDLLRRHAADGASRPRGVGGRTLPSCRWSSRSIR